MKTLNKISILVLFACICCSCAKEEIYPENLSKDDYYTYRYVNTFAFNSMKAYYLWIDEISDGMSGWKYTDEPIAKVKEIRYKDEDGNDIDRWTQLTDDYEMFINTIAGVGNTYGFDYALYYTNEHKTHVAVVVTFTYENGPAREAGLKRGDMILELDGESITVENYVSIITSKLGYSSACTVTLADGREIALLARSMYSDPVNVVKVIDCGNGKKVGYLHFTAFTMDACKDLVNACDYFKENGVSELVLDMRYNGGGYVTTSRVLASMLAPEEAVKSGDIFMTEVYNEYLTSAWGRGETPFTTSFTKDKDGIEISTDGHNIGITKIYALMTGNSASASEAILCGLKPYIDIEIIGKQSYGKYCTGYVVNSDSWFTANKSSFKSSEYNNALKYASNWGLYVMAGRYADKNGETACMPSGFVPDYDVKDNPFDGYELGDTNETMLAVALSHAGFVSTSTLQTKTKPAPSFEGPVMPKNFYYLSFL